MMRRRNSNELKSNFFCNIVIVILFFENAQNLLSHQLDNGCIQITEKNGGGHSRIQSLL